MHNTQPTTHNTRHTTHNRPHTTHQHHIPHTHTTDNGQRITDNGQRTTHNRQQTTNNRQHTKHNTQHTSLSSLEASQDGWLLHLSSSAALADWTRSAHDISTPLSCLCCSSCAESLSKKTPQLPPAALANDNACLHPPPVLQNLSLGEQMFVARGFALRRLRTLSSSGDPQSRQQGLLGTASAIAFPQNSLSVLQALPTSSEHLSDYLSIFFTDATISNWRLAKEFIVRRSAVHSALTWLVSHNPYYADVQIDPNALGQLPVNEIPPAWLAVAQATEQTVERCLGPADASSVDTALPSSIHAAVLTPGEDASDPLHLWDTALTACQRYERRSTNSSTDPSCHVHLAQEALWQLLSMSDHHTFHVDSRHQTSPSNQRQKIYAYLPHSDTPLDSYHPSFWTLCFPCLFPWADSLDGHPRPVFLTDHAWANHLLRRVDRPPETHWRMDLDFVALLFSILHRRRLLRAVRIRVRSPSFKAAIPHFCALRTMDFTDLANTLRESLGLILSSSPFFFLFYYA